MTYKAKALVEVEAIRADPLAAPDASRRAASGAAVRIAAYGLGSALAAAASILVLRYLGVADYGRYATVLALGAIVTGVSDAGLTLVGQREYVAARDPVARRNLASDVVGIRLLLTPLVVVLLILFSVAAGYPTEMVLGTAIVGCSVVVANVSLSLTIPMAAQLRFGAIAAVEVIRQMAIVAGNVLVVLVAGSMIGLFTVQVAAASVACALAVILVRTQAVPLAVPDRVRSLALLREAAPMGLALIVGALYLRALLVLTSLLDGPVQTGLFAASNRIVEVLAGIPGFVVGAAFPLAVRASLDDTSRLQAVLQTTLETTLFIAIPPVILLLVAPGTVVELLGGHAYAGAATVLRIQAVALVGSFVSVVWTTALVAIRRQAALLVINVVALLAVIFIGGLLIGLLGARGAALASVTGEVLIAAVALWMLIQSNRLLRPSTRFLVKHVLACLGAACPCFILGIDRLASAVVASIAYVLVVTAMGGLPTTVRAAFVGAVHRIRMQ